MDFAFMLEILPRLLSAAVLTIQISLIALALGFVLGLLMGVGRVLSPKPIQWLIDFYVTVCRGTPIAVQIYACYFLLPRFGLDFPLFVVGVISLSVNTIAYQTEIVRGALESVGKGQVEAARALGMLEWQSMVFIKIPQAFKQMLAPMTNELANLIKASSSLMIISVYELTKAAHAIIASTFEYAEVLLLTAVIYFVIVETLCKVSQYIEKQKLSKFQGYKTKSSILDD